uniref:DNA-damage-repair/toleration protein DRT100 n=1 Tax=Anthurium amnicola TaxID=1678845 RepID=A0A1D1ZG37_9ARAE
MQCRRRPAMANLRLRHLLAFLLLLSVSDAVVNSCTPSDREALLAVKSALVDERHMGVFSTWSGTACCSGWYGVSCDPTDGRVTDITLRGESEHPLVSGRPGFMSGHLSPSLCRLDRLTTLVLADWRHVSGPIPSCLPSSLPHLRVLDLTGNQVSGPIPRSLPALSSLMHLDLTNNRITGDIPANFGDLGMLSRALLGGNLLTGDIPTSIGNMNRLADLDLGRNQISGEIPESLGGMRVLSTLYLEGNGLSGRIPGSLLANRGLSIVNLSRNELVGEIPDVFHERSYFTTLDLSYNLLTGKVPATLRAAAFVGHLDLSHNQLCGHIPQGEPFDHLQAASFSGNDCLCGGPLPRCT